MESSNTNQPSSSGMTGAASGTGARGGGSGQKARVGATDFFLYVGFIAALYTFIGTFLTFAFSVINTVFPDRQYNFFDPYASGMRFSVSMLIVVTPLVLFLLKKIHSNLRAEPAKKDLWVRRWGLYLTLTLSIIALAIDLVTLINTFLGGEITARFVWKAALVLIVGGLVWWYTRHEIRHSLADSPKTSRNLGIGFIVIVLASVITGFMYIGSPTLLRHIKDDNQRETDLQTIKYQVVNYYQSKNGVLPQTLAEMSVGDIYGGSLPKDPATDQPYEYKILADKLIGASSTSPTGATKLSFPVKYPTFELCATFAEDGKVDERVQGAGAPGDVATMPVSSGMTSYTGGSEIYPYFPENVQFSDHPAGNKCFEISIDPQRYPPNNYGPIGPFESQD